MDLASFISLVARHFIQYMPLHEAYSLCPEAKFLPLDEGRYGGMFEQVVSILEGFSPVVEMGEQRGSCTYFT